MSSLVINPDEGHGFRDPAHIADLQHRIVAWFDRYLKKIAHAAWMLRVDLQLRGVCFDLLNSGLMFDRPSQGRCGSLFANQSERRAVA
jgi:hypothetical protein